MFCNEVRVAVCKVICVCTVREFKGFGTQAILPVNEYVNFRKI